MACRRSGASFYILAETGKRAVGMHLIDNSSYLFDENGYIMTGWQEYDGETYYFDEDGVMQKGTVTIDGVKYHLSDEFRNIPNRTLFNKRRRIFL